MDVENILDGLATRLATISGLRVYSTVPDRMEPPAAMVALNGIRFGDDFTGSDIVSVAVMLAVTAAQGIPNAQAALFAYLDDSGTSSVHTAVNADRTLSSSAMDTKLIGADSPRTITIAGTDYVGIELTFEVIAT